MCNKLNKYRVSNLHPVLIDFSLLSAPIKSPSSDAADSVVQILEFRIQDNYDGIITHTVSDELTSFHD